MYSLLIFHKISFSRIRVGYIKDDCICLRYDGIPLYMFHAGSKNFSLGNLKFFLIFLNKIIFLETNSSHYVIITCYYRYNLYKLITFFLKCRLDQYKYVIKNTRNILLK